MPMEEFIRCPKCGELDECRSKCRCGYSTATAAPRPGQQTASGSRRSGGFWSAMLGKVRFLLLLVCAGVFYLGYQEYAVGKDATEQPQEVDLAKLEGGQKPGQNHIRIGKHVRLYPYLIYSISARDKNDKDAPINHSFYPIISMSHPDLVKLMAEDAKESKEERLPFKNFTVLVKTTDFHRLTDIPMHDMTQDSIQGMVVNRISELTRDEAKLINESFPNIETTQLIILEQGRKPSSPVQSFAMMGGASLVALLLIASFFWGSKDAAREG